MTQMFNGDMNFLKLPQLKNKNIGFRIILRQTQNMRLVKNNRLSEWEISHIYTNWNKLRENIVKRERKYCDELDDLLVDIIDLDTMSIIGVINVLDTNWFKRSKAHATCRNKMLDDRDDSDDDVLQDESYAHDMQYEYPLAASPNTSDGWLRKKSKSIKPKRKPIKKTIKKCSCKKK